MLRDDCSYWTIEDNESVVFPMHQACLDILRSVLAASGTTDVDKKALYETMCLLSTMFQAQLTIEYGNIRGNATDWECIPGEEVGRPLDRQQAGPSQQMLK